MIDRTIILAWKQHAPWINLAFVEQDLIISRALVEIYNHPLLKTALAFRGGTALQKCYYKEPTRYSEDLDFVQVTQGAIGPIFDALREVLEPWLGKPRVKLSEARATQVYRFISSAESNPQMKLKIEINTVEDYSFLGHIHTPFSIKSGWFNGNCEILTFHINELLGTKLRALFQRKKGRDLFDLARAIELLPIDIKQVVHCFNQYMGRQKLSISRAEFEANMIVKSNYPEFVKDMEALLPEQTGFNFQHDYDLVMNKIIVCLAGEPWKGNNK
jgi:predicted nucleotidyltransferase component of viral defense system